MTSLFKALVSSTVLVVASAVTFSAMAQVPAAPSVAASSPLMHSKGIKDIDTNKDKLISRDEAKGRPKLEMRFDAIDSNKDGQLSREEMKAYRQAHKGERKGEGKSQPKS